MPSLSAGDYQAWLDGCEVAYRRATVRLLRCWRRQVLADVEGRPEWASAWCEAATIAREERAELEREMDRVAALLTQAILDPERNLLGEVGDG